MLTAAKERSIRSYFNITKNKEERLVIMVMRLR